MTVTPIGIQRRPFSRELHTFIMLPDGIFDTAFGRQWITCYFTNTSSNALQNVSIYLEGVGDPGILPEARSHVFPQIDPGASVFATWLADFGEGTPGKKLVSFIAQAESMAPLRILKRIFVSKTIYDKARGDFILQLEEGRVVVSDIRVIAPETERAIAPHKFMRCRSSQGPWVPKGMAITVYPNPPYAGQYGDLPFSDPWLKVAAWILFLIACIVAALAAKEAGEEVMIDLQLQGSDGVPVDVNDIDLSGFRGSDEGVKCCPADPGNSPTEPISYDPSAVVGNSFTVTVASYIASAAFQVGCSDVIDPWRRGQENTQPLTDELTTAERLEVVFGYPEGAPNAGVPYPMNVGWIYSRTTTGGTYTYQVEEMQKNTHISEGIEIALPSVHHALDGPLIATVKFTHESNQLYRGDELYAFAVFRSPDNVLFYARLADDGIVPDSQPNDGVYTGSIDMAYAYRILLSSGLATEGLWHMYVFAQDVNDATPDMAPEIAAQHIGGCMVASSLKLTFDSSLPCPMHTEATVHIIV